MHEPGDFDELVADALAQPLRWDFSYLDGRAVEARPSWRYFDLVVAAVVGVERLLDVETGTGDLLADLPSLPPLSVGTDAHPPSIEVAGPRLRARGAHVVRTDAALPFRDATFDWSSRATRSTRRGGRSPACSGRAVGSSRSRSDRTASAT